MASILFTKLSSSHFDASETDGYGDVIEGYGIDAPDWIPSGACKNSSGPEHHCVLRDDPKSFARILSAFLDTVSKTGL